MKILYLNHTNQVSGAERSLLTLLKELPPNISCVVACPRGPLFDAVRELGLHAWPIRGTDASLRLHPLHTSKALLDLMASGRELTLAARRTGSDLVHANSIRAGMIAVMASRLGGPPAVVHVHDRLPRGFVSRATLELIARGAERLLACSEYVAGQLSVVRRASAVRVVHNPVDVERFNPDAHDRSSARARLGLETSDLALTVIAQITPWKAQDDAVRTLALVLRRHRNARLLLVGSPKFVAKATRYDNQKFTAELTGLIRSMGVEEEVLLLGERDDIPEILAATDILLVPSWEEPFGMAMIEAMAMEVPVIATDVGGTGEIIDGTNGVLVRPRKPELWAAQIERLVEHPELRGTMGRRSRERVVSYLSAPLYARRVASVYEDVLASGRSGARWSSRTERKGATRRRSSLTSVGERRRTSGGREAPAVAIASHRVGPVGGMERAVGELVQGLLRHGYQVTVVASRCELPPHPSLRVIRIPAPQRPFLAVFPWFGLAAGLALKRAGRETLVHTVGALVPNRADVSTVQFCHRGFEESKGPRGSRPGLLALLNIQAAASVSRLAERWSYRPSRVRCLVAVSEGVADELRRHFPALSEAVSVIPNGVDVEALRPDRGARESIRSQLGVQAAERVALFVGGDWERKGLRFAVEAIGIAREWRLVVVGKGDIGRFRALAASSGAADRVDFVGWTDPGPYYAAADAFVFPTFYEAFPLVALEAAAAGLPLLITPVNGARELVSPGRNGWLVERSPAVIAERLKELGSDPVLRASMGREARAAAERYDWGQVVDAYDRLYRELAAEARNR